MKEQARQPLEANPSPRCKSRPASAHRLPQPLHSLSHEPVLRGVAYIRSQWGRRGPLSGPVFRAADKPWRVVAAPSPAAGNVRFLPGSHYATAAQVRLVRCILGFSTPGRAKASLYQTERSENSWTALHWRRSSL
jgi:hypothetical protein